MLQKRNLALLPSYYHCFMLHLLSFYGLFFTVRVQDSANAFIDLNIVFTSRIVKPTKKKQRRKQTNWIRTHKTN